MFFVYFAYKRILSVLEDTYQLIDVSALTSKNLLLCR